jgi:hypothetical protein
MRYEYGIGNWEGGIEKESGVTAFVRVETPRGHDAFFHLPRSDPLPSAGAALEVLASARLKRNWVSGMG